MDVQKQFELLTEIQGDLPLREIAILAECSKKHWWCVKNGRSGISKKMAKKLSELSGKPLEKCLI